MHAPNTSDYYTGQVTGEADVCVNHIIFSGPHNLSNAKTSCGKFPTSRHTNPPPNDLTRYVVGGKHMNAHCMSCRTSSPYTRLLKLNCSRS